MIPLLSAADPTQTSIQVAFGAYGDNVPEEDRDREEPQQPFIFHTLHTGQCSVEEEKESSFPLMFLLLFKSLK